MPAPMQLHCICEQLCILHKRRSLLMLSLLAAVRQRPRKRQSLHCPASTTTQAAMAEATASIARLWLPKSGMRTQLSCACTTGLKLAAALYGAVHIWNLLSCCYNCLTDYDCLRSWGKQGSAAVCCSQANEAWSVLQQIWWLVHLESNPCPC